MQLLSDSKARHFPLDPRTKVIMILAIAVFTMGGVGSDIAALKQYSTLFSFIPVMLMLISGKAVRGAVYGILYLGLYLYSLYGAGEVHGALHIFLAIICMAVLRLMPGLVMGAYTLSTTTVSEFIAAMGRLHIPAVITIPLSVMFRFFPTVIEEFSSINTAMKMRDIRFGGRNAGKMLEYRIIPLLVCSASIGSELSAAALTRGLTAKHGRTNICKIGFHLQDILLIILSLVPVILLICGKAGVL